MCKGICERLGRTKQVHPSVRHEYSYCSTCDVYYHFIEYGKRCPCCNRKLKITYRNRTKRMEDEGFIRYIP